MHITVPLMFFFNPNFTSYNKRTLITRGPRLGVSVVNDNAINRGSKSGGEFGHIYGSGQQCIQRSLPQTLEQVRVRQFRGAVGVLGDLASEARWLPDHGPRAECRARHEDGTVE